MTSPAYRHRNASTLTERSLRVLPRRRSGPTRMIYSTLESIKTHSSSRTVLSQVLLKIPLHNETLSSHLPTLKLKHMRWRTDKPSSSQCPGMRCAIYIIRYAACGSHGIRLVANRQRHFIPQHLHRNTQFPKDSSKRYHALISRVKSRSHTEGLQRSYKIGRGLVSRPKSVSRFGPSDGLTDVEGVRSRSGRGRRHRIPSRRRSASQGWK
jgi:hypothetical protein